MPFKVKGREEIYHIPFLAEKAPLSNSFYLTMTNSIPFTHPVQSTASLLTAVKVSSF